MFHLCGADSLSGKDKRNYSTSRGVRIWRVLAQVITVIFRAEIVDTVRQLTRQKVNNCSTTFVEGKVYLEINCEKNAV